MKVKKFNDAMGEIDAKYIQEAVCYQRKTGKPGWVKWGAMAACVCLLCVGGFALPRAIHTQPQPSASQGLNPPVVENFVPVSALLAEPEGNYHESVLEITTVPVGQYQGMYEKIPSVGSDVLAESLGKDAGGEGWYLVSGHDDWQYLIQCGDDGYSLWKFMCFDCGQYPYKDVLELVYQIYSADDITEIVVDPATMDNTEGGKAVQAQIGTHRVTDRDEIGTLYHILSAMTCYGQDNWDRINLGMTDGEDGSHRAVRLGRYLTLVTDYGNEIDGLKYTAVSQMFYEYYGIAYHPLTEEEGAIVCRILHIDR